MNVSVQKITIITNHKILQSIINVLINWLLAHQRNIISHQRKLRAMHFKSLRLLISSRPFCCRDKGVSGDGQGSVRLFLHFFWPRCAKRQKSRKSPRAPCYSLTYKCGLPSYWLNTRCLLLDWDVRRANLRWLFPHTHSHWASDGGKHFFSIIDTEKLSRRRRRSARITKHAHCPCGYVAFFSLSHIWVLCYNVDRERLRECVSERSRCLLYNVTCAVRAALQQWKWDLEWRKFSGRRCSMQIAGYMALSRSLAYEHTRRLLCGH